MVFKRPTRRENSENIIPLINIIFLLLMFFMVTAKLSPQDPFQITPPNSTAALTKEKNMDGLLYLSIDGQLVYNKKPVSKIDLLEQLDPRHFDPDNAPLRFKVDARASVTAFMEIVNFLKSSNINNIELLTLKDY